jgi:hypothetical protein
MLIVMKRLKYQCLNYFFLKISDEESFMKFKRPS